MVWAGHWPVFADAVRPGVTAPTSPNQEKEDRSTECTFEICSAWLTTNSAAHGFHDGEKEKGVPVPEKLCLIHEEVSEALGEYRSGRMRLWFSDPNANRAKPEGFGVELADALIRICDLAESLEIDLETLIALKHRYNVNRPHKHGKVC